MALVYRGREFRNAASVANTVEADAKGTYRGASVSFRKAQQPTGSVNPTRQYRGVTY